VLLGSVQTDNGLLKMLQIQEPTGYFFIFWLRYFASRKYLNYAMKKNLEVEWWVLF
jgi:hypothetical protein